MVAKERFHLRNASNIVIWLNKKKNEQTNKKNEDEERKKSVSSDRLREVVAEWFSTVVMWTAQTLSVNWIFN